MLEMLSSAQENPWQLADMAAEVFDLLLLGCKLQSRRQVASSFPGNLKHSVHIALSKNAQLTDRSCAGNERVMHLSSKWTYS